MSVTVNYHYLILEKTVLAAIACIYTAKTA